MFSKLVERIWHAKVVANVPPGFRAYAAEDFARQFNLADSVARLACKDYRAILDGSAGFASQIRERPRDGTLVSRLCSERYTLPASELGDLVRFFMNIATVLKDQATKSELGIAQAKWISSRVPPYCHASLDGASFDPRVGTNVDGSFVLPGATFECTCISKSVIRF